MKIMKHIFGLFLGIICLNQIVYGQTDSLNKVVSILKKQPESTKRDTLLVKTLNDYAKEMASENHILGLPYAREAEKLAIKAHWDKGLLLSYKTISSIQNIANQHYEAIQTGLAGLALAEKTKDKNFEIVFYRSLGNNYDMLDNYDKALFYYNSCLSKSENFPKTSEAYLIRGHCFIEIGDAYRLRLKQPAKAKKLIEEGIKIYQSVSPSALGYGHDYLGQALTDLKEYKQAEETFKLSRIELEKYKHYYLIPELLFHTAQMYLNQKNYDLAKKIAQEGVVYSQKQATVFGESEATKILYTAYKESNQPIEALRYYEIYTVLRDSLTKKNIDNRFEQVQADYKSQKQDIQIKELKLKDKNQELEKQKTIGFYLIGLLLLASIVVFLIVRNNLQLRQKNREISEAMLRGQTIERRRVAIDLHDNLGSTLSSISWSVEAIDKSKMPESEKEIYTNLQGMIATAYEEVRLLSHNLLPEELEKQGLVTALQIFVRKLNKNTKTHFELQIPKDFQRLGKKIEFELYSISLELVNNILKHSHATEASIVFEQKSKYLYLKISDNGRGIFENNSDGKGLKNVQARVESLNGKWIMKSKENEGINSIIKVPI